MPRPNGEIVIITDASNVGGGATVFQWQSLDPLEIPRKMCNCWCKNWCNPHTQLPVKLLIGPPWSFQLEMEWYPQGLFHLWTRAFFRCFNNCFTTPHCFTLAHHMVLWPSSSHNVSWLSPPINAWLKCQYVYLSQFQLRFIHLPGLKNKCVIG